MKINIEETNKLKGFKSSYIFDRLSIFLLLEMYLPIYWAYDKARTDQYVQNRLRNLNYQKFKIIDEMMNKKEIYIRECLIKTQGARDQKEIKSAHLSYWNKNHRLLFKKWQQVQQRLLTQLTHRYSFTKNTTVYSPLLTFSLFFVL